MQKFQGAIVNGHQSLSKAPLVRVGSWHPPAVPTIATTPGNDKKSFGIGIAVRRRESNLRTIKQTDKQDSERILELEEANAKLRALDRFRAEFLASMSHELRTPLNAVIGFSQLMYDGKTNAPLSPEQKEFVGYILDNGKHLLDLINEALDSTKVDAGRMQLSHSSFAPNDIIVEVEHSLTPIAAMKGLGIVRDIAENLPEITTDRKKLLQILLNLASNAVKFTEHGEIRIGCKSTNDTLQISMTDSGIGIARSEISRFFQAFLQSESGVRKRAEGTGLGLYLSRKLARMLGGDLTVESEYGKGATFKVSVPLSPPGQSTNENWE